MIAAVPITDDELLMLRHLGHGRLADDIERLRREREQLRVIMRRANDISARDSFLLDLRRFAAALEDSP